MSPLTRGLLFSCMAVAISTACAAQAAPSTPSGVPEAKADAASARQHGRAPCESNSLGMSFAYPMHRTADGKSRLDLSVHPTLGTVCPGSPAERAGLAEGDVVLELNGRDYRDREARDQRRAPPGTLLLFRVRRGDVEHEFTVEVPPRPSPTP